MTSRIDAWANGGANDICPAGFSVPTGAELTAELTVGTTTNATAFSSFLSRVNTRILIYQRLKQGVMHFFSNATNTKAEGTTVELEGCIAAGDVQTLISRTTPQVGARANRANRAILVIAVASNWDSQEAGEEDGHESRTSGTTETLASSITPATSMFIIEKVSPWDWTSIDSSNASRIDAIINKPDWIYSGSIPVSSFTNA
jgi:hypothetical protein